MKWWHCVIIYVVANIIAIIPAGFNGDEAFYNSFTQPGVAPPDWLFAPMWLFLNITSLIGLYTVSNLPVHTKKRKLMFWNGSTAASQGLSRWIHIWTGPQLKTAPQCRPECRWWYRIRIFHWSGIRGKSDFLACDLKLREDSIIAETVLAQIFLLEGINNLFGSIQTFFSADFVLILLIAEKYGFIMVAWILEFFGFNEATAKIFRRSRFIKTNRINVFTQLGWR